MRVPRCADVPVFKAEQRGTRLRTSLIGEATLIDFNGRRKKNCLRHSGVPVQIRQLFINSSGPIHSRKTANIWSNEAFRVWKHKISTTCTPSSITSTESNAGTSALVYTLVQTWRGVAKDAVPHIFVHDASLIGYARHTDHREESDKKVRDAGRSDYRPVALYGSRREI